MRHKSFIHTEIMLLLLLACQVPVLAFAQSRPNIILIVSDDGGYEDFGAYGSLDAKTPNIDRMARHGIRFINAYATASVCAPSRAGLLTGSYQQRYGFDHNISNLPAEGYKKEDIGLDTAVKTLADHLKYNGYKTIAIGKWHQGDEGHHHPQNRGFDHFFGFIGGQRSYYPIPADKQQYLSTLFDDKTVVPEDGIHYLTRTFAQKATDYIEKYRDRPFFMYMAFNAVHTPMEIPPGGIKKQDSSTDSLRKIYLGTMQEMDDAIGLVLTKLEQEGIYENTFIIFVNDNGAAINNGADNGILRGLKGSKWEGGIRIPFIMQWPGHIPAQSVSNALVSTMDILPTTLNASGGRLIPGHKTDGIDLLETLNNTTQDSRTLFWRRGVAKAVRHRQWKLISVKDNPILLFDLEQDPIEAENIAKTHPNIVASLLEQLVVWEEQMHPPKWFSPYGDSNQILKHRMEVKGREMEKLYP